MTDAKSLTVVVRVVARSIIDCQLTCIDRVPVDLSVARAQHDAYVDAFRSDNHVAVEILDELAEFPDSVFVEDVAIIFDECAIATRPGAVTRRGEVEGIMPTLHRLRSADRVHVITDPAIVDGGDVAVVGKWVFVGCSTRTNTAGFEQLTSYLTPYGYTVRQVKVTGCLHLKSAVCMLNAQTVLIQPAFVDSAIFTAAGLKFVEIHPDEPHSANVVSYTTQRNNGTVRTIIVPSAFPLLRAKLEAFAAGPEAAIAKETVVLVSVDMSELAKAEGAATCCSLLFYRQTA